MDMSNNVSLSVALVADYRPAGEGVASWDHDGCLNVLIPSFRGDFLLKNRKSLVGLMFI